MNNIYINGSCRLDNSWTAAVKTSTVMVGISLGVEFFIMPGLLGLLYVCPDRMISFKVESSSFFPPFPFVLFDVPFSKSLLPSVVHCGPKAGMPEGEGFSVL